MRDSCLDQINLWDDSDEEFEFQIIETGKGVIRVGAEFMDSLDEHKKWSESWVPACDYSVSWMFSRVDGAQDES